MANIYSTPAAQKDILYTDWICKTNYVMQMNTGASIHGNTKMTPARMRRWYLQGLTPYDAAQRLNSAR